ncbi:hypothetical protein [Bradyrhizobium erythrophlei]|uniref:hypothetical protein n=1 Tax=Bradyrhizobium erythrophlei TaxID=1437360 RepID=UPI0012ABC47F|nr:hypothetical protein [Bradyrhizobium erythrophlei]
MGLTTWRYPSSWVGLTEHFFDAERAQQVERGLLDGGWLGRGFSGFGGQWCMTSDIFRHCEERSDEAIHTFFADQWIASLRSQ